MSAYFVIDLTVLDPDKLKQYEEGVMELVRRHGGEFLVRGGDYDVIEGNWRPGRLVIARYPSRQAIRNFYDDPDYEPYKKLRTAGSMAAALAVEGFD